MSTPLTPIQRTTLSICLDRPDVMSDPEADMWAVRADLTADRLDATADWDIHQDLMAGYGPELCEADEVGRIAIIRSHLGLPPLG